MQKAIVAVLMVAILGVSGCAISMTPLMKASIDGRTEKIISLIENGAHVDENNETGQTPLMLAVLSGQIKSAEVLLEKGANFESKDVYGRTPLMFATLGGDVSAIELLLSRGAGINIKDNFERTAHFLGSQTPHFEVVCQTLENHKEISIKSFDFTVSELQIQWQPTKKPIPGQWESPDAAEGRPYYRNVLNYMEPIILTIGPYRNRVYWASVSLNKLPQVLFLAYYGATVLSLIEVADPSVTKEEKSKILDDLKLYDDFRTSGIRYTIHNDTVYSLEVGLRKDAYWHFTTYPRQLNK